MATGIDIVSVDRIVRAMRNPRFLDRILTPDERRAAAPAHFVAGRWAAKEAIAKALGLHLRWHDVEVRNAADGQPVPLISGLDPNLTVHLSISHEKTHAIALAIVERL